MFKTRALALLAKVGLGGTINWYALGIKALLLSFALTLTWIKATEHCETKHLHEQITQQTNRGNRIADEAQKRLPEVNRQTQQSTEQAALIKELGQQLDEANKALNAGGCHLSPDQLRSFQQLAEQTKHR